MPSTFRRTLALAACLVSLPAIAAAQSQSAQTQVSSSVNAESRPRRATLSTTADGAPVLSTDPVIISTADEEEAPVAVLQPGAGEFRLLPRAPLAHQDQMLLAAIDLRIGAPYVWGAAGPRAFDCSGFVWSVFRSAGIDFERESARSLWARFRPAGGEERYRFGTLVFFNNLQHVGIVVDDRGFYHASRSHGVTYSTFDGYWGERIDGFRTIDAHAAE